MKFYYVVVDFYPDLNKADEFEEVFIPYHTFEDAVEAVESTMDIYDDNNENNVYDTFWILDIRSTVGFITIRDNDITRAFRFEVLPGEMGMLKMR